MQRETIVFQGVKFHRYPNAKGLSDQRYYRAWVTINGERKKEFLHRFMWIVKNGSIPDGYHVHHKDENFNNNTLDNFELLHSSDHLRGHYERKPQEYKDAKLKILLTVAQEAAKDWHGSKEGKEWHRQHAANFKFGNQTWGDRECEACGKKYTAVRPHQKVCSGNCSSMKRRRQGKDLEERQCKACGTPFNINKYTKTECCSKKCGWVIRRQVKAAIIA